MTRAKPAPASPVVDHRQDGGQPYKERPTRTLRERASAKKRGRVRTKAAVSIRLDEDLVARLQASGAGWQTRVNDALREWADEHLAAP